MSLLFIGLNFCLGRLYLMANKGIIFGSKVCHLYVLGWSYVTPRYGVVVLLGRGSVASKCCLSTKAIAQAFAILLNINHECFVEISIPNI